MQYVVLEELATFLSLFVPGDLRVLQTWADGMTQRANDELVEIVTAIAHDCRCSSSSASHCMDKLFVAVRANAEAKYAALRVSFLNALDDSVWVVDLTVSEQEDACVLDSVEAPLIAHCSHQGLQYIRAAHVCFVLRDFLKRSVTHLLLVHHLFLSVVKGLEKVAEAEDLQVAAIGKTLYKQLERLNRQLDTSASPSAPPHAVTPIDEEHEEVAPSVDR